MMNPKNGLNLDPYSPPPWEIRLAPFFSENLCLFYVRHINFKRLPLLRCKFSHHFHFSEFCCESNFSFIQSLHFHFHFSTFKNIDSCQRSSLTILLSEQFLFLFSDFLCLAFDQFEEHRMIPFE